MVEDENVSMNAGHVHQQGAYRDSFGIHHYTVPAILETPRTEDTCHGIVYVGSEGLVMEGSGACRTEAVATFGRVTGSQSDVSDVTAACEHVTL